MWFITLVIRNLLRRTTRSMLTGTGAAVAIGTVVALLGVINNFRGSLTDLYAQRGIDMIVVRAGAADRIQSLIPEDIKTQIEDLPQVEHATPGLLDLIAFPKQNLFAVPLSGRVPGDTMLKEPEIKIISGETLQPTAPYKLTDHVQELLKAEEVPEDTLAKLAPLKGRVFATEEEFADEAAKRLSPEEWKEWRKKILDLARERTALLGKILAGNLGKQVGDTITIYEKEFKVGGIFQSFSPIENGSVFVPIRELQELMQRPKMVTAFMVQLKPDVDKRQAAEQVRIAVEKFAVTTKGEPVKLTAMTTEFHTASAAQIQLADAIVWLVSGLALILGSIGMLNTMIMSVSERTREIGILRALGWRKARVVWMILLESWIVALYGALFGVAGAYVVVWALSFHPTVGGSMSPWLPTSVCVYGVVVGFVMGLIGGLYPAIRAAMLLPSEAVRHE